MNTPALRVPKTLVPGLLTDEALQEQLKQFTQQQNATIKQDTPTSAVSMAQRVQSEYFDAPVRATIKAAAPLAGPLGPLMDTLASSTAPNALSPRAAQDARASDIGTVIANEPGLQTLVSPLGALLSDTGPIGALGQLTPEEQQAQQQERIVDAQRVKDQAVADQEAARDRAAGLTDNMLQVLAGPLDPGVDPVSAKELREQQENAANERIKAAEQRVTEAEKAPPPKQTWWLHGARTALKGFSGTMTGVARGAILPIEMALGDGERSDSRAWIDTVDTVMEKMLPGDKARSKDFFTKLTAGGGGMVGFMAAGFAANMIGLPASAATTIVGAAQGGADQFEDAERFGASGVQKLLAYLGGGAIGASEAIPINRALGKIEQATGGSVSRLLQQTASSSLDEFLQELGQSIGQDFVAQKIYDENRQVDIVGALENAAVGGILGGMMGSSVGTLRESGLLNDAVDVDQQTRQPEPTPDERQGILDTFMEETQNKFEMAARQLETATVSVPPAEPVGEMLGATAPVSVTPTQRAQELVAAAAEQRRPATQLADELASSFAREPLFDYSDQIVDKGGTVPAPGDDGFITLRHYASQPREVIDPAMRGTGPLRGDERARLQGEDAVDRSYYGVYSGADFREPRATLREYTALTEDEKAATQLLKAQGVTQAMMRSALESRFRQEQRSAGYRNEGLGNIVHEVKVRPDELYNANEDPLNLRDQLPDATGSERVTRYERLVKEAGFRGMYFPTSALGQTAILFDAATPAQIINEQFNLPVSEIATRADFENPTPETFRKGGWAVVTATQEAQGDFTSEQNRANDERLRKRLKRDKIEYMEVKGAYQGAEQGTNYLIFAPEDYAKKLGAAFSQESILTRDGLIYTDGSGRVVPSRGTTVGPEAANQDFYSTLPDGTSFTMDLDFANEGLLANRAPVRSGTLPMFPERSDQSFDRWFEGSKVVDENGDPLVVYHGTPSAEGFRFFDPDKKGITSVLFSQIEQHRQGFFFAENSDFAKTFAEQARGDGGKVMELYLSIKNPLDVSVYGDAAAERAVQAVMARAMEIDTSINNPDYVIGKVGTDSFWEVLDTAEGGDVFVQAARDLGYDGVRMVEPNHETGATENVWVAFDNTQIKSAEDNTGAYNPDNPDIYSATATRTGYAAEQRRPKRGIAGQADPEVDVNLARISDNFIRLLDLTVRQGRFTLRGANVMGQFSTRTGVIRLRTWNDLSTLVHEGGHAMEQAADGALKTFINDNKVQLQTVAKKLYGGDLSNAPESVRVSEGFAEFFRTFTLNRQFAQKMHPTLTQNFEDLLRRTDPALMEGLDAIGDQFAAWLQMPSAQLVRNMIVSGEQETGVINEAIREIQDQGFGTWMQEVARVSMQRFVNKYAGLNTLVNDILNIKQDESGQALDLTRAADPRVLIRLAANSGNRAMVQITDGVMPYQSTTPATASLRAALLRYHGQGPDSNLSAIDPVRQRDFAAYLVALRGVDEYRRYAQGLIERPPLAATQGDLTVTVKEMEAKYGDDFKQAAQMVHEYGMGLWEKSYQAGLISDETYKDGLTRQFYVPLQRDISDKATTVGEMAGPVARGQSVIKRFRGSDRDVIDPMDSLMAKTFMLERVIAENDVKLALARLADKAGAVGALVERVPAHKITGTSYSVQEIARQLTKDPTISQADAADLMTILESSIEEGNRVALHRSQQALAAGENIVFFWENGKLSALQLADGDIGYDVVNTLNGIGHENIPTLVNLVSHTSSVFRSAVTSWPDFLLVNFIRDQMSAFILTNVGYKPFVTGLRGVGDELRQADWARQYNAAMGIMGGMNSASIHQARVNRDIAALRNKGYVARVFGAGEGIPGAIRGLARVTELTETGTRLGVFRATYEKAKADGLTDWEASIEASYNATDYIDFGLRGNQMLLFNRTIPFLNAQLQGLYKMMRTLGGDEVRQRKGLNFVLRAYFKDINNLDLSRTEKQALKTGRAAWVKMASLGLLSALLSFAFQDDPDYQDASEYLRTTGWVIPLGNGEIVYIPKPFELAILANFVERAYEHATGDQEAKHRFLRGAALNLVPPTAPPAVMVGIEQAANYSFFSGREIVPDYMRALAPELQYNHTTTEFAKQLGSMFGWSPMRIDHVMSGLGASAYRDLTNMYNMTDPNRPSSDKTDWPITRRFVRDARRGAVSAQDFWKMASTVDGSLRRAELTYKNYIDAGREKAAEDFLNDLNADDRAYALLNTHFKADAKRLHPFYRTRQLTTIVSAMRRELYSDLGVEYTGIGGGDPLRLSAKEKAKVDETLSEYARREVRNAMVYMKSPGWETKAPLPTEPTLALLAQISPDLADEFDRRVRKAKVYDAEVIQDYWPDVKDRLLSDRENAFLNDVVSIAKVMR